MIRAYFGSPAPVREVLCVTGFFAEYFYGIKNPNVSKSDTIISMNRHRRQM